MTTPMIKVNGVDLFIVPSGFTFVRQDCVKFYGKRLSKKDLIKCCEHFIFELKNIYSPELLKIGFNLKCFKYYELSLYLHGLISLLCSKIECSCPSCFGLFRFSRLPHDIMKPELKNITVQVAKLEDMFGGTYFCCVISGIPIVSDSFYTLHNKIYSRFLNIGKHYNIRLDLLT